MEINLLVHLKAGNDVVFDCVHAATVKRDATCVRANDAENSGEIETTVLCTGKVRVTQQIIHAVGICLTRNHLDDLGIRVSFANHAGYLQRKVWGDSAEHPVNLCGLIRNNLLSNGLVVCVKEPLKSVGIGSMTYVVQQGCTEGNDAF